MLIVKHTKNTINEARDVSRESVVITASGIKIDMDEIRGMMKWALDVISNNSLDLKSILDKKNIIYVADPRIKTMATDGASIYVNPGFVYSLIHVDPKDPAAVAFVLAHEAMHILLDHCLKYNMLKGKGFGDHDRANRAMDCEVNYILEYLFYDSDGNPMFGEGMTEAIHGWINKEWGDKMMTWEEMYPLLPERELKEIEKKKMSDKWNKGFVDGYNEYLKELRKNKLIERYEYKG